ncbi:MAG: 2-dehydro-3-deoxygalactonokinase [Alphaproteobacteria bacterium]|nr:MAG: 2-dehydro-3-deoxygalactonokinase [Alphaproteobacteria bacterium]
MGVDWGTSRLRAWGFDDAGRVLFHVAADAGMGGLDRSGFEPALLQAVGPRLRPGRATPVVACGMVGSRQGWVEAPYRDLPCPPLGAGLVRAPAADPRLEVHVVPGLRQRRPHADVMRGEETQIAGFLAAHPGFDGVICLPGTHAKWAEVSAGEVTSFATFMTGELFAALSRHTVLRHSLGDGNGGGGNGGGGTPEPWDDAAFDAALAETLSRPERLARALFSIRAEDLVAGLPAATARARLSGCLVGAELAAARPWWLGRAVAIVGAPGLAARYARALDAQGVRPRLADADEMTRRGLAAAHAMLTRGTTA